jgi:hypothetical protein
MVLTLLIGLAAVWMTTIAVVLGLCVCAARTDREIAGFRRRSASPRLRLIA